MPEIDTNRTEPWRHPSDRRLHVSVERALYRAVTGNVSSYQSTEPNLCSFLTRADDLNTPPFSHPFARLNEVELVTALNLITSSPHLKADLVKTGTEILANRHPVAALYTVLYSNTQELAMQRPADEDLAELVQNFGTGLYTKTSDFSLPEFNAREALEVATIMKHNPELDLAGKSPKKVDRQRYTDVWEQRQRDMLSFYTDDVLRRFWSAEEHTLGEAAVADELCYCFNFMASELCLFTSGRLPENVRIERQAVSASRSLLEYYVKTLELTKAFYIAMFAKNADPELAQTEQWLQKLL
jgi:hypothetical protein